VASDVLYGRIMHFEPSTATPPEPVSIIIPAFNEHLSVGAVVEDVLRTLAENDIPGEVIVVDDGSSDGTGETAYRAGARVMRHRSNRGYGSALKTGIMAAAHNLILITDADGTYPVKYIPELVAGLESADMVVGARMGKNVAIPLVRRPAKWVLNKLANYVAGHSIPDLNSGLRVFRKNIARQYFAVLPDQFSFTTTITLAMHCDNYAVQYNPVDYLPRQGKSKIVPWDAASFAVLILRTATMFRPLRVFLPIVGLCLTYGIAKMWIDMTRDPNISASALGAFMSALIVLLIGLLADGVALRLGRIHQNVTGVPMADELSLEEPVRVTASRAGR
jgi:glycosyltransferase involved in cell wall biosynthesis